MSVIQRDQVTVSVAARTQSLPVRWSRLNCSSRVPWALLTVVCLGTHGCKARVPATRHSRADAGALSQGLAVAELSASAAARAVAITSGFDSGSACALLDNGNVRCWFTAQRGPPSVKQKTASAMGEESLHDVAQVAGGNRHTCVLLRDHNVSCWGSNDFGQLGNRERGPGYQEVPAIVLGLPSIREVTAGSEHTCAIDMHGKAYCWGGNTEGESGAGKSQGNACFFSDWKPDWSLECVTRPTEVAELSDVKHLAAGAFHTCALRSDGTVWCWGGDDYGELGTGAETTERCYVQRCSRKPVQVSGLSHAVEIVAGAHHSCVRLASGEVKCWGLNDLGQLGRPPETTKGRSAPNSHLALSVAGISNAQTIFAGGKRTCALAAGGFWCWGDAGAQAFSSASPLRCKAENSSPYPCLPNPSALDIFVGLSLKAIGLGSDFICVLSQQGDVYCRSDNCRFKTMTDSMICGPNDTTQKIDLLFTAGG